MAGTGKSFQDRELAAEVRSLCLNEIRDVLLQSDKAIEEYGDDLPKYKKEIVLKMSTAILPRLQEHSGPEGSPIPLLNVLDKKED